MNGADTAWIMVALVLFMTLPGLALFYGGLVRARNVLSVFMQCFGIAALMSVLWLLLGYSIAFGGANGVWGGLGRVALLGVGPETLRGTLPVIAFFAFVMTFSGLWMLAVYAPVTHWIWGGGLMADGGIWGATGTRDFAGGIVVHETAALAALLLAVMIGPRRHRTTPPHSPGMVAMGAGMLWVGWFGFNGGSQLAADGGAAMAITVTHLSAAAASLSWAAWERIKFGRSSLVGIVTGTLAGILCQEAVVLIRERIGVDDTRDVFAVHGVGGIFGTVMIAVFGHGTWVAQLGALAVVGVYTLAVSWLLAKAVALVLPMRVDREAETNGLDLSTHGERAYDMNS